MQWEPTAAQEVHAAVLEKFGWKVSVTRYLKTVDWGAAGCGDSDYFAADGGNMKLAGAPRERTGTLEYSAKSVGPLQLPQIVKSETGRDEGLGIPARPLSGVGD